MSTNKIRNTFFGLLTLALLAGPAQDVFAQRTNLNSERRNKEQRVSRTTVKKEKATKNNKKSTLRRGSNKQDNRSKKNYSKAKKQDRKKEYRNSKKDRNHYSGKNHKVNNHVYKPWYHQNKNTWRREHYRSPSWVDFHRYSRYRPAIGARFSILPRGFISFRIGKLHFYTYHGVYYRYDPALRVYYVVEKPAIRTTYTSTKWDRITLMDGSTIEGAYLGGDDETVQFEVGDAILEIPMSEIKVLSFSE